MTNLTVILMSIFLAGLAGAVGYLVAWWRNKKAGEIIRREFEYAIDRRTQWARADVRDHVSNILDESDPVVRDAKLREWIDRTIDAAKLKR